MCPSHFMQRNCTLFERNPAVCLCPGKGSRKNFYLELDESTVPNVPGAPTKLRDLITFNRTVPGPTLVVTEGMVSALECNECRMNRILQRLANAPCNLRRLGRCHCSQSPSKQVPSIGSCEFGEATACIFGARAWRHSAYLNRYCSGPLAWY